MLTLPEIVERPAQPYAYVKFTVRMDQMKTPADQGFPQIFAYLDRHGLAPAGAAFYNYRRIDMAGTLDVEAGIPLQSAGPDDGNVRAGVLPAGRFMTLQWHGHFDALETVTGMLIGWSRLTEQPFDMHEAEDGEHFACRLEIYETDPSAVPDPEDWVTTLAFKLKD